MTTWTVETVQTLIQALEIDGAHQVASALTWALERINQWQKTSELLGRQHAELMAERDAANARAGELPQDVVRLVEAGRLAWEEMENSDTDAEIRKELDEALEAFSERVKYDDEPEDE